LNEENGTDEEEHTDNYDQDQYSDVRDNFLLEEMGDIVQWVHENPNYITRFRDYIKVNGTRLEKLK
jgi:protein associated with RNAse G/E